MNYLVTGATGFIGSKLVTHLLAQGHSVQYLARQRSATLDSRAAFFCWNPAELPPLDAIPRLDAVIHLAGEPIAQRWTPGVKERIRSSRVEGTRKLVAAIANLRFKPSVLVSASAIGYYGDRGNEILTETSSPGDDFLARVCIDWEREAVKARDAGLSVIPVRIATVLGREGGALPRMLPAFRYGLGARFGSGAQWMPWIHIDDLVNLLHFAASNPSLNQPLNAGSPNPVTNANFTKALARAVHRPAVLTSPKFALRLALGEMSDFLFSSTRVLPAATSAAGFRFEHPTLDETLTSILDCPK